MTVMRITVQVVGYNQHGLAKIWLISKRNCKKNVFAKDRAVQMSSHNEWDCALCVEHTVRLFNVWCFGVQLHLWRLLE